ncbi:MAG: cytochrome c maturation protein CcmE [Gammaproteobacteria bacterium]|nr:cytochrome c maturation protein CcmE [Gammaproteobacteria bacterium]
MKARHRRFAWILAGILVLALAAWFVLQAFRENLVFYFTPTELAEGKAPSHKSVRVGGLVEGGSVQKTANQIHFNITDTHRSVRVQYVGLLPDLFRENKGVVAQGKMATDGVFRATEVLAKHDENYMPAEVSDAIKKANQWKSNPSKP